MRGLLRYEIVTHSRVSDDNGVFVLPGRRMIRNQLIGTPGGRRPKFHGVSAGFVHGSVVATIILYVNRQHLV